MTDALEIFVDETEMDLSVDGAALQADKSSLYIDFIEADCGVGYSANNELYYCGKIAFHNQLLFHATCVIQCVPQKRKPINQVNFSEN